MVHDSSPSSGVEGRGVLHRFGSIGDLPTDPPIERLKHRQLIYMGLLMSMGAVGWSALSLGFGLRLGGTIPLAYLVLTAVNFAAFARTKRFGVAAQVQIFASVLLPVVFQWSVGGLAASGASMLWALVAVVGSLTFASARTMSRWLVIYVALGVASIAVDGSVRALAAPGLSETTRAAFLGGNIVAVSVVILALVFHFLRERERALEALAAAKVAIADLRKEVDAARQLGQYTLAEKIGEGGMGAVFRARHALLRRPMALKLVQAGAADERTLARFEQEVQLTATLTHPNIVTIYDYGRTDDGTFYYVMELLDGADLELVVRLAGALPGPRVIHVVQQVAEALGEAHAKGLIHRDVKPANVLLTNAYAPDVVKVVDFGLVKQAAGPDPLSPEGVISGTLAFMSPEAVANPDTIDAQSDVYSLGCLAYYLLTASDVFAAETASEMIFAHARDVPVSPSVRIGADVPRALEELVLACLAKEPAARPTMADLASALRAMKSEPWGAWNPADAAAWWKQWLPVLTAKRTQEPVHGPKTVGQTLTVRAA